MSVRPWRDIERRKCRQIMVGNVPVGGDAPIAVQSMTNTLTSDAQATIRQVNEIAEAGADIVRVSCPDVESTKALKEICANVPVPIVADSDVIKALNGLMSPAPREARPRHSSLKLTGSLRILINRKPMVR